MGNEDKWYISGPLAIGTTDPKANLSVSGAPSTTQIETSTVLHLLRPVVPTIKNDNSVGLAVGAFEEGPSGRARLDIKLSGPPQASNEWGRIPDVSVMTLRADGNVGIGTAEPKGKLDVQGDIRAGNSDIYFTKTDHVHSGIGNTAGYAAIENAQNLDALAILGRTGTDRGRKVRLWDYLEVNGPLDVTGDLTIGSGKTISSPGRLHISGDENLFLLNKGGVIVSKARQGNGNLTVEGNFNWGGDNSDSSFIILGTLQICWGSKRVNVPNRNNSEPARFPRSFKAQPFVTISLNDPGPPDWNLKCGVGANDVGTSGFTILCKATEDRNPRELTFTWIAIGKA